MSLACICVGTVACKIVQAASVYCLRPRLKDRQEVWVVPGSLRLDQPSRPDPKCRTVRTKEEPQHVANRSLT
jgi:hypothetical protein